MAKKQLRGAVRLRNPVARAVRRIRPRVRPSGKLYRRPQGRRP